MEIRVQVFRLWRLRFGPDVFRDSGLAGLGSGYIV